jgi:hypothetical protein
VKLPRIALQLPIFNCDLYHSHNWINPLDCKMRRRSTFGMSLALRSNRNPVYLGLVFVTGDLTIPNLFPNCCHSIFLNINRGTDLTLPS